MRQTEKSRRTVRLLASLAMLTMGWMFSGTAAAQSCPGTLSDILIGGGQGGAQYVRHIKLWTQVPNADGTVSLCRYSGTKYLTPTGGSEQSQGTYYVDRISAASGVNDPSNAYVVKLFDLDGKYECNGTAILPDWVLTAGHCVDGSPSVAVGSTVTGAVNEWVVRRCFPKPVNACLDVPNPYMQLKQVSKIHRSTSADMALLRLQSPLVLTRYGTPSAASTYKGGEASAKLYSWQCNDPKANKATCPNGADALSSYSLTVWRDHECKMARMPYNDQLCSRGRLTIGGDSGGPLIYRGVVIGVLSGNNTLIDDNDAIFADVTQAGPWIGQVTGLMQPPTRF